MSVTVCSITTCTVNVQTELSNVDTGLQATVTEMLH